MDDSATFHHRKPPTGGMQANDRRARRSAGTRFPKTVTITFFEEPDTLNQLYSGMWFSQILTESYLRGLWNFDNQLEMVPKMAAEIPTTENGGDLAD